MYEHHESEIIAYSIVRLFDNLLRLRTDSNEIMITDPFLKETGGFPSQSVSYAESVGMTWRHPGMPLLLLHVLNDLSFYPLLKWDSWYVRLVTTSRAVTQR